MSEEKLLIGAANNNDDKNEEEEMEIVGDDLLCGLGSCRPAWLQKCNNIKLFMFVINILSMTQGKAESFICSFNDNNNNVFDFEKIYLFLIEKKIKPGINFLVESASIEIVKL